MLSNRSAIAPALQREQVHYFSQGVGLLLQTNNVLT
jgi:hypothetical protein